MIFADTSALIKLYIDERGSETMAELVGSRTLCVSDLAYAEAHAAFARRRRDGVDDEATYARLVERFDAEWRGLVHVTLQVDVLEAIPPLCKRHPLRVGDAIQLASALKLARVGHSPTFACNDARLLAAAAAEGLEVVDPVVE